MPVSLPIVTFHALEDRPSVIAVPPRVFREGLARLDASGYRTVSLLEADGGRGFPPGLSCSPLTTDTSPSITRRFRSCSAMA